MPGGPGKGALRADKYRERPGSTSRPFNRDERTMMKLNEKMGNKPGAMGRVSKAKQAARKSGKRATELNSSDPRSSSSKGLGKRPGLDPRGP